MVPHRLSARLPGMEFRPIAAGDLPRLAALAAPAQRRPETHVAYLGFDTDSIAAELEQTTWATASMVALDGGVPVGFLIADVDPEMGRVWWFGPFVDAADWENVATDLLERCRAQLDETVDEEEMAFDTRAEGLGRWAERVGMCPDPGALVLSLTHELEPPTVDIRPVADADRVTVAPLHERLFPGTHTTGDALVDSADDTHLRLVVEQDGAVAGYIAVERQQDGGGYIDFVGVHEAHRRRGLGAQLVQAGVSALRAIEAWPVHLTVREDSAGARALYSSLGFDEERIICPYRRGFTIA